MHSVVLRKSNTVSRHQPRTAH